MGNQIYANVPETVGGAVQKGVSPLKAWREYKELSMEEMALRLEVSTSVYEQAEDAKTLGQITLKKAAIALGISLEQIQPLYENSN
ncbi:MAG: helix-turn-helix transcriptional regulator [Desulfarculales bacterium]|jgi:transcriptional regulator with XRE-family HTH domain|nr:helix-turn-helix transcriptional regulator [Desulfarculales bacterium]